MNTDAAKVLTATSAYETKKKSTGVAWLLWWFTGAFGGHRFYLGDTGYALGMLFTLGGLGVWALIDAVNISRRLTEVNEATRVQVFQGYGLQP